MEKKEKSNKNVVSSLLDASREYAAKNIYPRTELSEFEVELMQGNVTITEGKLNDFLIFKEIQNNLASSSKFKEAVEEQLRDSSSKNCGRIKSNNDEWSYELSKVANANMIEFVVKTNEYEVKGDVSMSESVLVNIDEMYMSDSQVDIYHMGLFEYLEDAVKTKRNDLPKEFLAKYDALIFSIMNLTGEVLEAIWQNCDEQIPFHPIKRFEIIKTDSLDRVTYAVTEFDNEGALGTFSLDKNLKLADSLSAEEEELCQRNGDETMTVMGDDFHFWLKNE